MKCNHNYLLNKSKAKWEHYSAAEYQKLASNIPNISKTGYGLPFNTKARLIPLVCTECKYRLWSTNGWLLTAGTPNCINNHGALIIEIKKQRIKYVCGKCGDETPYIKVKSC